MSTAVKPQSEFQSSELSRNSSRVFAAAADHPVTVTRRDGEALVLMSKSEADARQRLLEIAAQMIAAATDDSGSLAERMAQQFPWMLALHPGDQKLCAEQLLRAARASFATNQAHLAVAEVNAWFETASAIAAGLDGNKVDWLEGNITVERP